MYNQGFAGVPANGGKEPFMESSSGGRAISPLPTSTTSTATVYTRGQVQGGDGIYPVQHHHPQGISELANDNERTRGS
jgi:hypothetical protein